MATRIKTAFSALIISTLSFTAAAEPEEIGVGQMAPDFQLQQMDGSHFKLSDYRGKQSVYLIFWNTWCTYCMKKIPKLKHAQAYLSDQIRVIAVNTGLKDSLKKMQRFKNEFQINYPLALDQNKQVTDLYGVWGTPTEFIIDINGVIQHRDRLPVELEPHLASWNQASNALPLASANDQCDQRAATC